MNREIKFEHMLIRDSKVIRKETFKLTEAKPGYALVDGMSEVFRQFTGLLDKYGKDIYEGDVIFGEDGEHDTVVYKENKFILEPLGDDCVYWNKPEIIGNIYENPELLVGQ